MQKEKEKQKGLRDAEEERLKREMAEREKQRARQEHENIRKKEAEKRIEQLKTTDIGIRALEGLTQEVCVSQVLLVPNHVERMHIYLVDCTVQFCCSGFQTMLD